MFGLNYRDPRPIYIQLKEKLRSMVLTGVIPTDGKLPSVRELATELAVNPNTIQRAYRELEAEGYIYTVAGIGSFACALSEVDDSRRQALLERFDAAAGELLRLGVPAEELQKRIEEAKQK